MAFFYPWNNKRVTQLHTPISQRFAICNTDDICIRIVGIIYGLLLGSNYLIFPRHIDGVLYVHMFISTSYKSQMIDEI